jgi:hypothetical protein
MSPGSLPGAKKGANPTSSVQSWLLEESQPAIRYRTLRELLGRPESDPDVRGARNRIMTIGWAAEILAKRVPGGVWRDGTSQYRPKYVSTNWMMLVLSDLGLTRSDPTIGELCELWMKGFAAKNGGLGGSSGGIPHYCVAANQARALIRFGYADDSRVRRTLEWLVDTADPKGGWSCFGSGRNLDSWEAMSAFAAYPREKWTASMRACVERGAEFYLERRLDRQGARYAPWYRFHYPVHYYYDLLVGLAFMTALGYAGDPRMRPAVAYLRSRRRRNGTWNLDAVHPDVEGPMAKWFASHPPIPFALERAGRPSKMITLTALRVLDAVDRALPRAPPST